MLRDYVEKVLIEYNDVRNKENFSDNPLAKVLRNEFPNYLKELTDIPGNYKFYGSAGQGNWTYSPWVAVFNKKITESAQKGYYIVYLFCEDMKGVYLSLNQGMTDIKKQTSSNSQTKDLLSSRAEDFRNQLKDSLSSELLDKIDLEIENSPNAPFYEAGNIYAKYYSLENLPSEESLEADFKEFLRLYDLLVDKRNILEIIQNQLNKIDYLSHSEAIAKQQSSQLLLLLINQSPNANGILTGKFYEYLASKRPILAIGPIDGDAARVLRNTEAGAMVGFSDENATKKVILDYYASYKNNTLAVQTESVVRFSRRSLTGELATLLNSL